MAAEKGAITTRPQQDADTRPHQRGQSAFRSVLSEDIDWKPFAAFPPEVRIAIVVGEPSAPGPYVIRVKVLSGVKWERVLTGMTGMRAVYAASLAELGFTGPKGLEQMFGQLISVDWENPSLEIVK